MDELDITPRFGALKSPDDPNDYIFERLAKGHDGYYVSSVPEIYDLRQFVDSARDQRLRGTCAAFTASAIKEIQEKKNGLNSEVMSPEFIYYHRENKPAQGMYGRNVFQILQRIGSVPESTYPYRDDELAPTPSFGHYKLAASKKISNFARVTTVPGLKRALLELGPCYMQLPLFSSRPHFWRAAPDDAAGGGHAVTVVGYNAEGFILMNSWGATWNVDGCVVMPYDDWGVLWECWVAVDEKIEAGPELIDDHKTIPLDILPRATRRSSDVTRKSSDLQGDKCRIV